jgi:hypothetical protein
VWPHGDVICILQSRSVYDALPNTALAAIASCASGGCRGYDELVPHMVSMRDLSVVEREWLGGGGAALWLGGGRAALWLGGGGAALWLGGGGAALWLGGVGLREGVRLPGHLCA